MEWLLTHANGSNRRSQLSFEALVMELAIHYARAHLR